MSTDLRADGIWTRLRRRKVVQWSAAYVAAAWALLQGLEFLADLYGWPTAFLRVVTLALAVGLPIVVTLAWYHGDRGEQQVGGTELTIVALLFLLGGGVVWYYQRTADTTTTGTSAPAAEKPIPTDASIAVLPFVNMSSDKEQEYFADGISEELLNLLAQVPELRVIARTSSFSFKGKEVDITEIARKLNVANVLEGSVRKSGDTLRITAQLVRASDSSHLWSKTYDRQMTDVFKVQDEIAAAVVEQLKIKLLGQAPKAREANPEAYALFLQARELRRQHTAEGWEQSITLSQQALALDAGYAAAWHELARSYVMQIAYGLRPREEGLRLAREAAARAVAIDPDDALVHDLLGWMAMYLDTDLAAAARHLGHALALEPANPGIIGSAAVLAQNLGRLETAIALNEYANARDPVRPAGYVNLARNYRCAGHLDQAIASLRTALRLAPAYIGAHFQMGLAFLLKGEPQAALDEAQKEPKEVQRLLGLTIVYHTLDRKAESDAALATVIKEYPDWPYNIAYALAWRNERDRAFEWLYKAAAQYDPGLVEMVPEPLFTNLHEDPRWLPFLRKLGMAPEKLAAIKFDVKVPK